MGKGVTIYAGQPVCTYFTSAGLFGVDYRPEVGCQSIYVADVLMDRENLSSFPFPGPQSKVIDAPTHEDAKIWLYENYGLHIETTVEPNNRWGWRITNLRNLLTAGNTSMYETKSNDNGPHKHKENACDEAIHAAAEMIVEDRVKKIMEVDNLSYKMAQEKYINETANEYE